METPPIKSEKIELEKELLSVRENLKRDRAANVQAREDLAAAEGEKTPFYAGKTAKIAAIVAGLSVGGYGAKKAGEYAGEWSGSRSPLGITQKVEPKKENPGITLTDKEIAARKSELEAVEARLVAARQAEENAKLAKTKAEADTMAAKIKAEMQAKFDEESAKRDEEYKKKLAVIEAVKPTPVAPRAPAPRREKEYHGGTPIAPQAPKEEVKFFYTQTPYQGGTPIYGGGTPSYYGGGTPAPAYGIAQNQRIQKENPESVKNPFGLTEKMLEKVDALEEENLVKVFPKDTLKHRRKVQNKNAYEFMSEDKTLKEYKLLKEYLKKLNEVTGLLPQIIEEEKIWEYVERALQSAASQGKLDEVKL
ncbi:hypothetical protein A2917_03145 [Candidatus Nomurabacteria bacterium RIFCSPLOWO2_01_FULL_42_17]|uniref:Uncharacterized protein n=1 Tax=Candidatus Nomurabacteria bacterium RIFCSPLOWO2_01_FULL_42_17 TaxID=1801780 RepID=A0A1F6XN44_9BACT|nr:MAG: hypothetical protein A2917_03145 [Candidatus Nomurabacteria bacterium RIFCSPLOWO2_01_FULL_42_17]